MSNSYVYLRYVRPAHNSLRALSHWCQLSTSLVLLRVAFSFFLTVSHAVYYIVLLHIYE